MRQYLIFSHRVLQPRAIRTMASLIEECLRQKEIECKEAEEKGVGSEMCGYSKPPVYLGTDGR